VLIGIDLPRNRYREDDTTKELRFGYLHAIGLIILWSVWFAGVHRLVQAVVDSCDASASVLVFSVVTILVGWVAFLVGGFAVLMFVITLGQRLPRAATGLIVVLWVLVVSYTYTNIATSTLADPVLMSVGCPDGTPEWWPDWIPLS